MGFTKHVAKRALVQLAHRLIKNPNSINGKKMGKYVLVAAIVGFIGLLVAIFLIIIVARWAWDAGSTVASTNPTVNSLVENSKETVANLLPSVPSSPQDFIQNGQIDQAKLTETYNALPQSTRGVWKNTMNQAIDQQIQQATGATLTQLQDIQKAILAL